MTTSHDVGREALAWEMLCQRLQRDPALSEESDTCSLRAAWKAMLAFADEATRPPAQAGAASVEVIGADVRAHLILDGWDKHPDTPPYWHRLPSWVKEYATECVAATERRLSATPAASGEIPAGTDATEAGEEALRPMSEAPKDRSYVLARYNNPSADERTQHYNGRWFVIRHEGVTAGDYDLGWGLFPGYGGVSDRCFDGWLPLPATPTDQVKDDGKGGGA